MNRPTTRTLLLIAGAAFMATVTAADSPFPVPPPSAYVDAESSVNVPLPTTEGRHLNLTLAFDPSPSNAVQVAFGRDLNGSETLEPEETELIVGCDCGAWFIQEELGERASCPFVLPLGRWAACPSESFIGERESRPFVLDVTCENSAGPSPVSNGRFHIRQALTLADRWTLAKVTTHNLADTNLTVTADFYTKGSALILW